MNPHQMPIVEYCLKHSPTLVEEINTLANEAKDNPILKTYFQEALLDQVRQHIAQALGLSYEEVSVVVDTPFFNKYIGV